MVTISTQLFLTVLLLLMAVAIVLGIAWERRRWRHNPLALYNVELSDLNRAFGTSTFGVILLNRDLSVRYCNNIADRMLETAPEWQSSLNAAMADDAQTNYRILNLPSQRRLSWWQFSTLKGHLVVVSDLSEQRQRERTMQEFWGAISHEMRTPLTSLLSHLDVVRSAEITPDIRDSSLGIMHTQTRRLSQLIQDVLELGKLQSMPPFERRAVDLVLSVEEAMAAMILLAEQQDIALSLHYDSPLPRVFAHSDRLKQVFTNLIDNAIKYGEAGDAITVTLHKRADGVRCMVRDNGPGISAEHLPHLTERFYRVNRQQQGSGLGLAIVNEILQLHESKLVIDSATAGDSTGTAFTFLLPTAGE